MWEKKDTFRERYTIPRIRSAVHILGWGYRQLSSGYKAAIYINAVAGVVPGLSGLYLALISKDVINAAVSRDADLFWAKAWLFIAVSLFNLIYGAALGYFRSYVGGKMNRWMRLRFYRIMISREYAGLERVRTGELINRLQNDISEIASTTFSFPGNMLNLLVSLAGTVILVLRYVPEVGIVAVPFTFFIALGTYLMRKYMKKYDKELRLRYGRVTSSFIEHLGALLVLRSFGRENASAQIIGTNMEEARKLEIQIVQKNTLFGQATGILTLAVSAGSLVYFCTRIMRGELSFGTFTMLTGLIGQLQGKINALTGIIPTLYSLLISSERVLEIVNYPDDMSKEPVDETAARTFYEEEMVSLGMRNVTFAYSSGDGRAVLEHQSIDIKKGEFIAFTGHSGCGKSTMQKLLLGLYRPQEGSLYIKRKSGAEELLDSSWRALFAYVPQQNYVLHGTIREAISFGETKAGASEEDYWAALRVACAEEFVRELESGLDTELGERGCGLSEGQIQRLAVARAIYTGRPVLLLDECTSSLDGQTEESLLKNIHAMTDRTVVIVTHRPAALRYCDREVSFERGLQQKG